MLQDIDIYGVFVPSLLLWMACAFALNACARRLLAHAGLSKAIWHPPLFDLALFVAILGGVVFLLPRVAP